MKTEKQIIKKYKEVFNEKRKLQNIHMRCKGINKTGYVTNHEHISGEKLCSREGFLMALEFVLDRDYKFWEKLEEMK